MMVSVYLIFVMRKMLMVMVIVLIIALLLLMMVLILILELTRPFDCSEDTAIDDGTSNDVGASND